MLLELNEIKTIHIFYFYLMNKNVVFLVIWIMLITIASIIPNINTTQEIELGINFIIRFDYLAHLAMFLVLTFLFFSYIYAKNKARHYKAIIIYVIIGLVYAGFCEYIQQIIPGRAFNINDFIYNAVGIVLGTVISIPLLEYKNGKYNKTNG